MSNHPVERQRGKSKTWATFSCQILGDEGGILCALGKLLIVVEAHVLSYVTHLFRNTICENALKKSYCFTNILLDLKILLIHQSETDSEVQTALQNSEKPTVTFAPAQNKLSGATICLTPQKVCVNNYRNFQQESTGVVHYWLSGLQLLFYERLRCCSKCFFAYKWFLPPIWCRGLILLCFQNFKTHNQA